MSTETPTGSASESNERQWTYTVSSVSKPNDGGSRRVLLQFEEQPGTTLGYPLETATWGHLADVRVGQRVIITGKEFQGKPIDTQIRSIVLINSHGRTPQDVREMSARQTRLRFVREGLFRVIRYGSDVPEEIRRDLPPGRVVSEEFLRDAFERIKPQAPANPAQASAEPAPAQAAADAAGA